MKSLRFKLAAPALLAALGIVAGCRGIAGPDTSSSDNPPFTEKRPAEVVKGTAIYVRLEQSISSATAQAGESFSAVLDEALVVDGKTVAPAGAHVSGRVVAARQSGRLHNAGYLSLTLSSIALDGKESPLETNSVFVEGGSFNNRNLAYIGGGTGGGALIGSLAGAAGSATAAYATGKKEVGFVAEKRLGFRLLQALNVSNEQTALR